MQCRRSETCGATQGARQSASRSGQGGGNPKRLNASRGERNRRQCTRLAPARYFFGKGFGDLPDTLAWLRPFGITGAVSLEHPITGSSVNFGVGTETGHNTVHWGFALEFSTLCLTSRFTPGKLPKDEPLNQLVPLVEFSFDSPRGQKTVATMNPGFSYVAVSWQVAVEAVGRAAEQ